MINMILQNEYIQSYMNYLSNLQEVSTHASRNEIDTSSKPVKSSSVSKALASLNLHIIGDIISSSGLADQIDSGTYTIFAPTDEAFNRFFANIGKKHVKELMMNPEHLKNFVRSHLVKGKVSSSELSDDMVGPSLLGGKLRSNLYTTETNDWNEVQIRTMNGGILTDLDRKAGSNLIHVVNRVLFPPANLDVLQILEKDPEERFSTFIKAIKAVRIDKEITNYETGPWTVFAPTNEAFMNLPMVELEKLIKDPKRLSKLVLNHIINKTIYSPGMNSHELLRMANGKMLNLFSRPDRLKLNGANVIEIDIPASNGVVQILQSVVQPEE